jgi:hypothetical protein
MGSWGEPAAIHDIEVMRDAKRLEDMHNPKPNVVEPGDTVQAWTVLALPDNPRGGVPEYEIRVTDEAGDEFGVKRASGERVYSITFRHNREAWTATVRRLLTRTKTWIKWRKPGVKLSSPQLVIAIFDGKRAMVVTDCWPFGTSRSEWANPRASQRNGDGSLVARVLALHQVPPRRSNCSRETLTVSSARPAHARARSSR